VPSRDAGPVILAGDVGGTKTALALFERRAPDLTLVREAALPGREFATLESAVARFLSGGPPRPIAAASFGIAVPVPYTIVRSTQFVEFLGSIAQAGTVGQTVHVSPALVQPIAADDVADVMADIALAAPANGTLEIAGPERVRLDHLVRRFLSESKDSHEVVTDSEAPYFGLRLDDRSPVPGDNPGIGATRFEDWLGRAARR